MREWCPKCHLNVTQYRVYRKGYTNPGRTAGRTWVPVGYVCSECGYLYKKLGTWHP